MKPDIKDFIGLLIVGLLVWVLLGQTEENKDVPATSEVNQEIKTEEFTSSQKSKTSSLCYTDFKINKTEEFKLEAVTLDAFKTVSGSSFFIVTSLNERKQIEYTFYINDNGSIRLIRAAAKAVSFRYLNNEEPYALRCDGLGSTNFYWVLGIPYGSIANTYTIDVEKSNLNE